MQKFKFQPKNLKSKRILTEEEIKVKPNSSLIIKNTNNEKHNTAILSNTGLTSVSKYDNIIVDMLKLNNDKTKSRDVSPCQSNKSIQLSSHFRSKSKSMNEDSKANFLLAITSPKIALVNLDLNKAESSEFSLLDEKKKQNPNTSKIILNKGNHHKRNSFSNTEDDLSKILSKKLSEASQNLQSNPSNKYSKIETKILNVLNNDKNTNKIKQKASLPIKEVNNGQTPINQNSKNLKNLKVLKIPLKRKTSQNLNLPIEIKKMSSTKFHNNIIKPSKSNILTPKCKNNEIFLVSNSDNYIEKDKLKIVSINLTTDTKGKEKISRNISKNKENDKFTVENKSSSSDQQDSKSVALNKKTKKKNLFVPTVKTTLYDLENTANNSFITNNNDSIIQSVNSLVENNNKTTKFNNKISRSFSQKIKDKLLSNSFTNSSNKDYDINISNVEYPDQGKFSFAKKNKKLSDNNDKQSIININNIINIFSTHETKDIFEQINLNKDIKEAFETKPKTSIKLKEARRIRSQSKNNRTQSDILYNKEIINNLIVLQKQCNDQISTGSINKINDKVDIEKMKKYTSPNKLLDKLREKVKIVKEQQM